MKPAAKASASSCDSTPGMKGRLEVMPWVTAFATTAALAAAVFGPGLPFARCRGTTLWSLMIAFAGILTSHETFCA